MVRAAWWMQEIYRIMKENHQLLHNIETCKPVVKPGAERE